MDSDQIVSKVEWIDEQRRKDAETISRLQESLSSAEEKISTQEGQIQELSSEVARLAALAARINQFDETLTKHRQEVSRQLEGFEDRRMERERSYEEMRRTDQQALANQMEEAKEAILQLEDLRMLIQTRKEEELRLAHEMDDLADKFEKLKKLDEERSRTMISIQEGRKQDSKRIGDVQAELTELRKKSDTLRGSLDSVEDRTRRLEVKTSEISAAENERREAQNLWMEQQGLKIVGFEKGWKDWEKRFDTFEDRAQELDERMQSYEETYRALKQMRQDLDDLLERLERRINEVSEMQRLAEDRIKQEWATFQADDQKRWNTYKLTSDEQWREHDRLHDKMGTQLKVLDENSSEAIRIAVQMREDDKSRMAEIMAMVRDWSADIEKSG
jgi:chromosome segregation ATPase